MGILQQDHNTNNILTQNGFKHPIFLSRTVRRDLGDLNKCYERRIELGLYSVWIAVYTDTRQVLIYAVHDDCSDVASYQTTLSHSWEESEKEFFSELDEYVTSMLKFCTETELD